jgi:hypothetical protein
MKRLTGTGVADFKRGKKKKYTFHEDNPQAQSSSQATAWAIGASADGRRNVRQRATILPIDELVGI